MRRTLLVVPLVLLAGCTSDPDPDPDPDGGTAGGSTSASAEATSTPSASSEAESSASAEPTEAEPTDDPTEEPADTLPPVRARPSLAGIMRRPLDGGRIVRTGYIGENDAYTRRTVTYTSDGRTVSGVLYRPKGAGPFPGIVLAHGYIDPAVYTTGQGLAREQDWLARQGYAVLHTDYRGHAASDPASARERELRLGYVRDAANAVRALAREPWVDGDRMAMLGRSTGGGVALGVAVAYPGLVDAHVVYASVSSDFVDNLRQFTEPNRPDGAAAFYDRYGTPEERPVFYEGLSPRTYIDRVTEPVLIHHGTSDDVCPIRWSRTTHRLLQRAGADSRLVEYDGEEHAFVPQWQDSIERTVRFLDRRLS